MKPDLLACHKCVSSQETLLDRFLYSSSNLLGLRLYFLLGLLGWVAGPLFAIWILTDTFF